MWSPRFQIYGAAAHQDRYASNGNDVGKVNKAFWLSPAWDMRASGLWSGH